MLSSVQDWLLEPSNPSVHFRARTELLDQGLTAPEIADHKNIILESAPVRNIFARMHPDAYWLHKKKGTSEYIGAGVEYASTATTHYCLAFLSELGLTRENPLIEKAAERYLNLQAEDGDWLMHLSCLLGYNIKTFIKLGFRKDRRLGKSVDLLLKSCRYDGGYLCDMHEKVPGRKQPKSCIRGSVKALESFAELGPEYWDHPSCTKLVAYFLDRNGIYKRSDRTQPVNKDVRILAFPFLWNSGLLQILLSLGKMGYGKDERLRSAWDLLESKKSEDGKYPLDWTPTQCPWKVGKRGTPNKWVTFYAYLAKKYRA